MRNNWRFGQHQHDDEICKNNNANNIQIHLKMTYFLDQNIYKLTNNILFDKSANSLFDSWDLTYCQNVVGT